MTADLLEHDVDYVQSSPGGPASFACFPIDEFFSYVNCEELSAEPARFHSPQIGVCLYLCVRIVATHSKIKTVIQQGRRDVVVGIDHDGLGMKPLAPRSKRGVI